MEQSGTIEVVGNTKTTSKKKKRRCWMFTWNNPGPESLEQLRGNFEHLGVQYVFQLEDAGTKHFQGAIYFKNPRYSNFQILFSDKIHWEWGRSWKNLKLYCCKLDTRIGGPWTNIKGLSWRKTIKDPLNGKKLYKWQSKILKLVDTEPDDRKIYWFWEYNGNAGKSALCKHIKLKYGKSVITVSGKSKDIFFGIKSRLDENIDIDIVLVDIPRSYLEYVNFMALEKLKDGYCFSGKYESNEILMNPPHVICFANEPPDTSVLSLDRWVIERISS